MSKKVIVVDDHPTLGDVVGQMLRVLGHQAHVFTCASECLEWLEKDTPDVALVDIKMPGVNGVALYEEIRRRGYEFPVVAITGYPGDPLVQEAKDLGVMGVIGKPISMDLLQGLVELNQSAFRARPEWRLAVDDKTSAADLRREALIDYVPAPNAATR